MSNSVAPRNTRSMYTHSFMRIRPQKWTPAALLAAKNLPEYMVTIKNMCAIEAELQDILDTYNDHD